MKMNEGVAAAAISLGVMELFNIYRDAAPSLGEIRKAEPGDFTMRQLVLDADMLGLIVVLAIGGGSAYLTGRWYPLILSGGSLAMISLYYRSVLNSSNEGLKR